MSDDLIRRSDAIEAIHREARLAGGFVAIEYADMFQYAIKDIPSADRPQGEWKRRIVDNGFNADWVCSECGYRVKTDFVSFNYCPNCGAQMKGAGYDR